MKPAEKRNRHNLSNLSAINECIREYIHLAFHFHKINNPNTHTHTPRSLHQR